MSILDAQKKTSINFHHILVRHSTNHEGRGGGGGGEVNVLHVHSNNCTLNNSINVDITLTEFQNVLSRNQGSIERGVRSDCICKESCNKDCS